MRIVISPQNDPAPTPTRPPNRRGVTWQDAEAICRLMAEKRFLPGEACALVGINYKTWQRFVNKGNNHVRISSLIERLRGARLEAIISRIDDASLGKNMKQPDWRAAAWMAQVIDRDRYGDQRVISQNNTQVNIQNINLMLEAKRRIFGGESTPAVASVGEPASLPVPAEDHNKR